MTLLFIVNTHVLSNSAVSTNWKSYNSILFWHYLYGENVILYKLRAQSLKAAWRQLQVANCHLYFWLTDYKSELSLPASWVQLFC